MKKNISRFFSLLLVLAMLVSIVPVTFASDTTEPQLTITAEVNRAGLIVGFVYTGFPDEWVNSVRRLRPGDFSITPTGGEPFTSAGRVFTANFTDCVGLRLNVVPLATPEEGFSVEFAGTLPEGFPFSLSFTDEDIADTVLGAVVPVKASYTVKELGDPLWAGPNIFRDPDSPTGFTVKFLYFAPDAERVIFRGRPRVADYTIIGENPPDVDIAYFEPGLYRVVPGSGEEMTRMDGEWEGFWFYETPKHAGANQYFFFEVAEGEEWNDSMTWLPDPSNPVPWGPSNYTRLNEYGVRDPGATMWGRRSYIPVYIPFCEEKQQDPYLAIRTLDLPRTDGQRGLLTFEAVPGSDMTRHIAVFTPYGYDPYREEPYRTIYLTPPLDHCEGDWFGMGAMGHIMDNMLAEGLIDEGAVIVALNTNHMGTVANSFAGLYTYIIPYVEANFNVSKDPADRACGGINFRQPALINYDASRFGYWLLLSFVQGHQIVNANNVTETRFFMADGVWDNMPATPGPFEDPDNGISFIYYRAPGGHDFHAWTHNIREFYLAMWNDDAWVRDVIHEDVELSFDVRSESFAWSEKTIAVVIDLGEGREVYTSDLTFEMFTAVGLSQRWNSNAQPGWGRHGERTISDIYASEINNWGTPAESGRYIVLEFKIWGPYGGLATFDGGQPLRLTYTVTANELIPLTDGTFIGLCVEFNKRANPLSIDGIGGHFSSIIDQFIPGSIQYADITLNYSVFYNRDADGEAQMNRPLFIHLHGGGQGGHWRQPLGYSNNGTILAEPYWQERFGAHILVPQGGWNAAQIDATAAVVRGLIADGYVDADRVSVSGYSAGGSGTVQFMLRHPDMLAAAIPIVVGAPHINAGNIHTIAHIPQWWINTEGEWSQGGIQSIWTSQEAFFGRAGHYITARATPLDLPHTTTFRPELRQRIQADGLAWRLHDVRYTRFWDNNIAAFPYGPDTWLDYLPHPEITEGEFWGGDGYWIFNGHQGWIPAFNGGANVMAEFDIGWMPREDYDGFTPGDSSALFEWMFAQRRPVEFRGTSRAALENALADNGRVTLATPGNFGISSGNTVVVPEGSTLVVTTTLNVRRGANLIVEGTLIVARGGRINNDGGSSPGGGTITIAEGGTLLNNGHVENVSNSTVINNGTIVNNARFEVRANTTLDNAGAVRANMPLNINRNANVTP